MNTDKKIKILAGITQDDELYFLEIEPKSESHDYFSMNGFTVTPMLLEEALQQVREDLESGEYWKQAVEDDKTTLGLDEWVDYVIDTDGNLTGFDNSLFDEFVDIKNEEGKIDEYIFKSESCGQHKQENLKHYFIPKNSFYELMSAWKKYHLKKIDLGQILPNRFSDSLLYILEQLPEQNITGLAMQAITTIKNQSK